MEEQDKTYMWLAIITFVGLALAIAFALIEQNELKTEVPGLSSSF
jgi:hypothetical protein